MSKRSLVRQKRSSGGSYLTLNLGWLKLVASPGFEPQFASITTHGLVTGLRLLRKISRISYFILTYGTVTIYTFVIYGRLFGTTSDLFRIPALYCLLIV